MSETTKGDQSSDEDEDEKSDIPETEILPDAEKKSTKDEELPSDPEMITTRSGGRIKPSLEALEAKKNIEAKNKRRAVAYSAYYDVLHEDDYKIQDDMSSPIAFAASSDEDTMYYHQAMAQPDAKQFQQATIQ